MHVLSHKELRYQRNYAIKLLICATRKKTPYRILERDPTSRMWRGYEVALNFLAELSRQELSQRGFDAKKKSLRTLEGLKEYKFPKSWATDTPVMPGWVGMEKIHSSHRAALLDRNWSWYAQFGWEEEPSNAIFWPGWLPRVGDYVVDPDHKSWLVHAELGTEFLVYNSRGVQQFVSSHDFYLRNWQVAKLI
jgi:hypothetical protein